MLKVFSKNIIKYILKIRLVVTQKNFTKFYQKNCFHVLKRLKTFLKFA